MASWSGGPGREADRQKIGVFFVLWEIYSGHKSEGVFMSDTFQELSKKHVKFIGEQRIFFVASAPNDLKNEYVNLSPKGYDALTVLDNKTVVYADYPGSGNETAKHMRQNGRLTLTFMSFGKTPMILRLYGNGEAVPLDSAYGEELKEKMGDKISPYLRQLIILHIEKVMTSCGFAVPHYRYEGDREKLIGWCKRATISGKIKKYLGGG